MTDRNWPDHIGVGLSVRVRTSDGLAQATIVYVKVGPSLVYLDDLIAETGDGSYEVGGSLHLKLDLGNGVTKWTEPTPGAAFVAWAISQKKGDAV